MPPRGSSTVRRRRLGAELRRLRDNAHLTIDSVAKALECSDSKISRIENGQVGATPRDVRDMLALYGVSNQRRDELVKLAREAREKGWWRAFGDLPGSSHVSFDAVASSVQVYQALLVPGLLQTAAYARAVIGAVAPELPPEEVERRVEFRMTRQRERLAMEEPPALWALLDEAVLRRPAGGREVMREQLTRLVEAAAQPTVTLQVVPFAGGVHAGVDGSFTLFTFPDPADPDVVYFEYHTRESAIEDAEEVVQYRRAFERLREAALTPEESTDLLATMAKRGR
ncbi:MAG TPA: helix-turn-helix transcriptional regulator [Actinomycetes bacterium]